MSFIPGAKAHADLSKPIILMYDGHGSHVTLEMIDKAMQHNIILFCLPPHTTHHLQPCDVGAFGPLKCAWNKRCDHVFQTTGEHLIAKDFVREYMLARKESFKVNTIKKAWEKSGINVGDDGPKCTPEMFTEADFAPSHSFSTLLHLPASFPMLPIPIDEDSSDDGYDDDVDNNDSGLDFSNRPRTQSTTSNHALFGPLAASKTRQIQSFPAVDSDPVTSTFSGTDTAQASSSGVDVVSVINAAASNVDVASGLDAASENTGIDDSAELPPFQSLSRQIYHDSDSEIDDNDLYIDDTECIRVCEACCAKYRRQRNKARQQRDEAATHALLAAQYVKSLQSKLNSKTIKKTSTRNVVVTGGVVTMQEGHRIAAEKRASCLEKEKKAEETSQKKKDVEAENCVRRLREGKTGMVFEGTLTGQKLPSLRDIAWTLGLNETGTCEVLIA